MEKQVFYILVCIESRKEHIFHLNVGPIPVSLKYGRKLKKKYAHPKLIDMMNTTKYFLNTAHDGIYGIFLSTPIFTDLGSKVKKNLTFKKTLIIYIYTYNMSFNYIIVEKGI